MLVPRSELFKSSHFQAQEMLVLTEMEIRQIDQLLSHSPLEVKLRFDHCGTMFLFTVEIKGELVLASSRSLRPIAFSIEEKETFTFSLEKEESEAVEPFPDGDFDTRPYVLALIAASVPIKIVGDDEKEHVEGDSWELISEEEYHQRKKQTGDARFAELQTLFEDEEEKS